MIPLCTRGSLVLIPMPPGTTSCLPSMNTSRCACTWYCRRSAVSGTRPASRASCIGFGGAGQRIDEIGCVAGVVLSALDDFDDCDDEHAPANATAINVSTTAVARAGTWHIRSTLTAEPRALSSVAALELGRRDMSHERAAHRRDIRPPFVRELDGAESRRRIPHGSTAQRCAEVFDPGIVTDDHH